MTVGPPTYINAGSAGDGSTSLTVTYADAYSQIDAASLSASNLAASNGTTVAPVSGVSIDGNTVTYTIAAPSGTWGASTQGTYTVSLVANQVTDAAGNAVAANPSLAAFMVDTVLPTASLTTPPPAYINSTSGGSTTTLTVTYADVGGTGGSTPTA